MAAIVARVLRSSLLEILRSDYVKLARAKGASETRTVMKHALRNAMIPTITVLGLQVGVLLGGNMIVETVFGWPELGRLVVDAIFNRDFPLVILYLLAAIFAPQITWHNPELGSLRNRLLPPVSMEGGSWDFPLGADAQGRDIYTRIVYGARVSLALGILAVDISVIVGVVLGAVAGYTRGRADSILSRFADLLMAFPFLIFAIGMIAFLGPGFTNLILALTFKGWVEFFRLARGEMVGEKTREYVEAARVTGRKHWQIAAPPQYDRRRLFLVI